jgi:hypothetical protein
MAAGLQGDIGPRATVANTCCTAQQNWQKAEGFRSGETSIFWAHHDPPGKDIRNR